MAVLLAGRWRWAEERAWWCGDGGGGGGCVTTRDVVRAVGGLMWVIVGCGVAMGVELSSALEGAGRNFGGSGGVTLSGVTRSVGISRIDAGWLRSAR